METNDAYRLARRTMDEHGLYDWTFKFDTAAQRFGLCSHSKRTISLSRTLTHLNPEYEVFETILHEIAHALAPASAGHNSLWRSIALSIGCSAKRTHSAITPPTRYLGICRKCGFSAPRNRRNIGAACPDCCKRENGGRYSAEFLIEWVVNIA